MGWHKIEIAEVFPLYKQKVLMRSGEANGAIAEFRAGSSH